MTLISSKQLFQRLFYSQCYTVKTSETTFIYLLLLLLAVCLQICFFFFSKDGFTCTVKSKRPSVGEKGEGGMNQTQPLNTLVKMLMNLLLEKCSPKWTY